MENMKHPLHIDVAALYDTVARSMAFKGKEKEHDSAVKRMADVIEAASAAWRAGTEK